MADPETARYRQALEHVRDRTIQGVVAMFLRQFVVMPVSLVATIFLARLLQPQDFGLYAIANFWIAIIMGVRDLGFGAALIQQKSEPQRDEWNTMFAFQSLVVVVTVAGLYVLARPLTTWYDMDPRLTWVIRGLSLVLLIGLMGSVPNVMLERRLAYDVIAPIDVAATVLFHVTAVALALFGYGVWSFIYAAIAGELVRTMLLFWRSAWRPGFSWNGTFLHSALKFGGLYQLGGLTSLLRDNIAPLLAGPLFGVAAVGYLKWAERTAYLASQVFTQIATRVSFPSLSRLQENPPEVGRAVEKMLRYLMLATVPALAVTAALIPWIIGLVFTSKWQPATVAFYLLTLRMVGGNITTPLIGVLNALGRVATSLCILSVWTVTDWGLALGLTRLWGFNGVAAAYALGVVVPVVWLLREVRMVAPVDLKLAVVHPIAAGVITGAVTWLLGREWVTDLVSLATVAVLGLAVYLLTMALVERGRFVCELQTEARLVKNAIVSSGRSQGELSDL